MLLSVFVTYLNRKYGGTGLGLTITQRLTEMLGGEIVLESELEGGSIFTLIFPNVTITDLELPDSNLGLLEETFDIFLPFTVLVVDDSELNQELIKGYLDKSHHQVLLARDGLEGIAKAKKYHPDVILLDLKMPKMSGKEVASHLQKDRETKDIPIVILTAALFEEEEEIKELCKGFLRKPLSRLELIAEFKKILPSFTHKPPLSSSDYLPEHRDQISLKVLESLPELVTILQKKSPLWQQICKTMICPDIKKFAQDLKKLGQDYDYSPLEDYGNFLENTIQEFDVENLPRVMEAFADVLQNLETLIQEKN